MTQCGWQDHLAWSPAVRSLGFLAPVAETQGGVGERSKPVDYCL